MNATVTNREDFIKFAEQLRQNYFDNPENWENKTIEDFLYAISSYTEDIQGYYDNMKIKKDANKADWQVFADIIKGATIYE